MYNAWGSRGPADDARSDEIGERVDELMHTFPFYGEARALEIAEKEYDQRMASA